jgi:hypothetical protein
VAGENSKVVYTYGWYSASAGYNNKGKVVIMLNAEKHPHLTLKLLA